MPLTDEDAQDMLMQVAEGRTALELGVLVHAAHEAVTLDAERTKHTALMSQRMTLATQGATLSQCGQVTFDSTSWDDIEANMTDGQGTFHIDIALGMVWKAILDRNQVDYDFALLFLAKAAHQAFPHQKQLVLNQ